VRWKSPIPLLAATAAFSILSSAAADAQIRYPPAFRNPYGYRFAQPESDLRLNVVPREAMVYIDGFYAGTVDEFDGVFQRLHVTPGEHELTLYLAGYRTIRQRLYLSPNASRKISETMEKLSGGEASEPPPSPPAAPPDDNRPVEPRERYPFPGRGGPPVGDPRRPEPTPPPPAESAAQVGSLVIRVQPGDTDVRIDGEHWRGPAPEERLVVQVSEGRHRVEVRKEGFAPFSTEVEVGRGVSLPLNVSLSRERR
jgi:hypothetical protein